MNETYSDEKWNLSPGRTLVLAVACLGMAKLLRGLQRLARRFDG